MKQRNVFLFFGIACICIAVLFIVLFLLKGESKVVGNWKPSESITTLTCESKMVNYPFFEFDDSLEKNLKIISTFDDKERIDSISLRYTLRYDNQDTLVASENFNHAAMNNSFASNKYGPDALGAAYVKTSDSLKFSIYASKQNLNDTTLNYFMLSLPKTLNDVDLASIQKQFMDIGLTCNKG